MLVAMFFADLYQEMVDFGLVIDGKEDSLEGLQLVSHQPAFIAIVVVRVDVLDLGFQQRHQPKLVRWR
jgi:hypothetical protein